MKYLLITLTLLAIGYWLLANDVSAQQSNQVIITWQANNYYPSDYQGKALATNFTPVSMSVELLKDGRLQDLSQASIGWFIDGKFINRAQGLKEILFTTNKIEGNNYFIQVSIDLNQETFEGTARINIDSLQIVIENPHPNSTVQGGRSLIVQAIPYFFNITSLADLDFSWKINGEKISTDGNQITLNLGAIQPNSINAVQIDLFLQNNLKPLEISKAQLKLTVK